MKNDYKTICRLCLQPAQLCHSHIFPEFFYEEMYDEKHRLLYVPTHSDHKPARLQKGLREHLLCSTCEVKLSKYEGYAKFIFFGGERVSGPDLVQNDQQVLISEKIDYKMLKLFQLSLLWRAGISSRAEFKQVNLGRHEEKLRSLILNEDPGEASEYGCALFFLTGQTSPIDIASSPERIKVYGHTSYRYMLGGFVWLHFVSSHKPPADFAELFLRKDGRFMFVKTDPSQLNFFQQQASQIIGREAEVDRLLGKI